MGVIDVYQDTLQHDFPLMMVVGREGNSDHDELNRPEPGEWDFGAGKKEAQCAFWNTAIGVLGWSVGLETASLKGIFKDRGSSPIAFTDASPFGIKHEVDGKDSRRQEISKEDFEKNVENIFGCKKIIDRVKLVILSGHGKSLEYPNTLIKAECTKRNIRYVDTHFFFGNNVQEIKEVLTALELDKVLAEIHDSYLASTKAKSEG